MHAQHEQLVQGNKHVRYMWVPTEDCVVVVTNNPVEPGSAGDFEAPAFSRWARMVTVHPRGATVYPYVTV